MSKATTWFSREEIRALTRASDAQGWRAVLTDWGLISLAFALAAAWPNVLTVGVALLVIGGRQLGLSILTHEAAHRTLFRTRWLNRVVGTWLCAGPVWLDVERYRTEHLQHHAHTGGKGDPDLGLVAPYPTSRASLARKLARDLVGITGARRLAGLLAMDLGFLAYTLSPGTHALPRVPWFVRLRQAVPRVLPVFGSNLALFAVLAALGAPWLYLLWAGAYLTTYSAVLRIRAIAEHAVLPRSTDLLENTRSTRASWLERLLVAPHHVNLHLEHHLLMTAPFWQLPAIRARLEQAGALTERNTAPGYLAVLRLASCPP